MMGTVCSDKTHEWVVTCRNGNYSAFNSYRFQPSDYSEVRCLDCGKTWRTKAQYVLQLTDMDPIQARAVWLNRTHTLIDGAWVSQPR